MFDGFTLQFVPAGLDHCVQHNFPLWAEGDVMRLLRRHLEVMVDSARHCMAAADACPGFPTDISAAFNVPTYFKILTCSWLLWGPRS